MREQGILMNYKHFINWESGQKRGFRERLERQGGYVIKAPLIHIKIFGIYPGITGGVQLVGKYNKPGKKCLQSDLKPGAWRKDMASWLKYVSKAESRVKPEFRFGEQSE